MNHGYITYFEVLSVIEHCMRSDAAYSFLNSAFDLPENKRDASINNKLYIGEPTDFIFNDKIISAMKTRGRAIKSERDFAYDYYPVDSFKQNVKSLIYKLKEEAALSELKQYFENSKYKSEVSDKIDFPSLLHSALMHAFHDYEYYNKVDGIWDYYKQLNSDNRQKKALSEPHKKLKQISDKIYEDVLARKEQYHALSIEDMLLSMGSSLPVEGKATHHIPDLVQFFQNSEANLYLSGDGGIGKTTLLIKLFNLYQDCTGYIPLFFSLTRLKGYGDKPKSDHSHYIVEEINRIARELSFRDFDITKLLDDYPKKLPKLLFLLDGVNEISNNAHSKYRKMIMEEMEALSKYDCIRILVTSRPFVNEEAFLPAAMHIKACGLSKDTIIHYLSSHHCDTNISSDLLDVLRSPLFLMMYAKNKKAASSKGAILYEYFNGDTSNYSESYVQNVLRKSDDTIPRFIPLLNDFIFPAIAFDMQKKDSFSISINDLRSILSNASQYVSSFSEDADGHFTKYFSYKTSLSDYADEVKITAANDVNTIEILSDMLSVLSYAESSRSFSFMHQHIRDYFGALMNLNALLLAPDTVNASIYKDALSYGWSNDILDFMKDVINQKFEISDDIILSFMQYYSDDNHKSHAIINNLLSLLAKKHDNDLSSLSFHAIDFSNTSFYGIRFYNTLNKKAASCYNCKFSNHTFQDSSKKEQQYAYWFYNNKPVLFDCSVTQDAIVVNLKDIISSYTIASYIYDLPDFFDFNSHLDGIKVSPDFSHIIICVTDEIQRRNILCDFMSDDVRTGHKDFIYVITHAPDNYAHVGFLPNGNVFVLSSYLEYSEFDFASMQYLSLASFDTNQLPDYRKPELFDLFISVTPIDDEKLLLCYNRHYNDDGIFVYGYALVDIKNKTLSYIENTPVDTPHLSRDVTPVVYKDQFYLLTYDGIYAHDLYSDAMALVYDLRHPNHELSMTTYKAMGIANGFLYVDFHTSLSVINLSDLSDIKSIPHNMHDGVTSMILNENYILFPTYALLGTDMEFYRIDNEKFVPFTIDHPGFLNDAYPDGDFVITVFSTATIALLWKNDLSLCDIYPLGAYQVISSFYHKESHTLCLSVADKNKNVCSTFVFQMKSSIELIYEIAHDSPMRVASDGKYLFTCGNHTLSIFDLASHEKEPLLSKHCPPNNTLLAEWLDDRIHFANFSYDYSVSFSSGKLSESCVTLMPDYAVYEDNTHYTRRIDSIYELRMPEKKKLPLDVGITKIDPDTEKELDTIPLSDLNHVYCQALFHNLENDALLASTKEFDYLFMEDGEGVTVLEKGNDTEPFDIIYGASFGSFSHLEDGIFYSKYQDNSYFSWDIKGKKLIANTSFHPGMCIQNCAFSSCEVSKEETQLILSNGGKFL